MPELRNMVNKAEPRKYCKNCNSVIPMRNKPAELPDDTVVVMTNPFSVVATNIATPSPPTLPKANTPTPVPKTAALPPLASSYSTAPAQTSPKNFTVTIPITVCLPVEAFYRNFPTDASGRRRRVTTTNLTYDVTADLPETRIPSDDEPTSTSYARPVNPYSSTTAQYQPTATDGPESFPYTVTGHDEDPLNTLFSDEQLNMNLPVDAGGGEVIEPTPQNAPQLIKRSFEEEVIGHNWIKFHDEEQPHASVDHGPAQMTTMQERHAPQHSRWAALRSILHSIGEESKEFQDYEGNKLKKVNRPKKQRQSRVSRIFDF